MHRFSYHWEKKGMSMIPKHTLWKHLRSILNVTVIAILSAYHHAKTNRFSAISHVVELTMLVKKRYQYLLRKKNLQIKKVRIEFEKFLTNFAKYSITESKDNIMKTWELFIQSALFIHVRFCGSFVTKPAKLIIKTHHLFLVVRSVCECMFIKRQNYFSLLGKLNLNMGMCDEVTIHSTAKNFCP